MASMLGNALQVIALVAALAAAICLLVGSRAQDDADARAGSEAGDGSNGSLVPHLVRVGYALVYANAALLTACIAVVLVCMVTENYTLAYVVSNFPATDSPLQPLYEVSAVWAGRQGSLLLWTWLISVFAAVVAFARRRAHARLSSAALAVTEIVVALFVATLVFSSSNNPFMATAAEYLNADGTLVSKIGGMNPLLMHWAMILHPPATFIGYAAMTIPFAYAMAALITGDVSARWVELCDRLTVFGFIFLSIGMGLGAVWAYVVLGWGGFWAWDAVENASLMSWLTCVAMIHSFTMYRKRGIFKRWSVFAATITFIFVVLGTFITRSGLVQSVHAFAEDPVSTYFFLAIMVVAGLACLLGMAYRHGALSDDEDIESLISKNGTYYLTNIVMLMSGVLVAYLTVSSALPSWMPLGGTVVTAGAYNAVARPVAVVVALLMAVCPLLGWRKTDGAAFARHMRVPAVIGAAVFAALMVVFGTSLVPEYFDMLAAGGTAAESLAEQGPAAYYFALTVLAFAAAALLVASSAYLLGRGVRSRVANKGESALVAACNLFRRSPAQAGGYLCHLGVGIVIIGLVGSMMYVRDVTVSLAGTPGESVQVGSYVLTFVQSEQYADEQNNEIMRVELEVMDANTGAGLGAIDPSMKVAAATSQTTLDAKVLTFPLEDLFVAFQGLNADGTLSLSVKVNPLILCTWIGGAISTLGIVLAFAPRRATPLLAADDRKRMSA